MSNSMVEPLDTKAWVMVPVEPTEEMVEAGWIDKEDVTPSEIWAAMIYASPSLPVVEGGSYEELVTDLRSMSRPSVLTTPDIHDYAADVICLQQQQIAALLNERTSLIETKREQIERLTAERDEARSLVVEANNSLYGSQGYFTSLHGGAFNRHHLSNGIEHLKEDGRDAESRVQSLEEEMKRMKEALPQWLRLWAKGKFGKWITHNTAIGARNEFQAFVSALKVNGNG